jgi:hypothetical protein
VTSAPVPQLSGHAEIAKRIDIAATAIFRAMTADAVSNPDLSLHPAARLPLGRRPGRGAGMDPASYGTKPQRSGST